MEVDIGYIPLIDSAPLIIGREKGFFADQNVKVNLKKLQSWDQIKSQLVEGKIQAAHMLITIPIIHNHDVENKEDIISFGMTLSQSGNCITISNMLHSARVHSPLDLAYWLESNQKRDKVYFGVVHPQSTHEYLLRQWLSIGGLDIGNRIGIKYIAPQNMVLALRNKEIDGYCVGEPWNQKAVSSKLGGIVATSENILPPISEKILGVKAKWHKQNPETHRRLILGLLKACRWLSKKENQREASNILCQKRFVNTQQSIIRSALKGRLVAGWKRTIQTKRFLNFYNDCANYPNPAHYLWYCQQMEKYGHLVESNKFVASYLQDVHLQKFYEEIIKENGYSMEENHNFAKLEGLKSFSDKCEYKTGMLTSDYIHATRKSRKAAA